jgi:hypothetical protein
MTVLSLEDSKALYDAGIKIETKYVHLILTDGGSEVIGSGSLCLDYYKNERVPAPDLEELLEYAPDETMLVKQGLHNYKAYIPAHDGIDEMQGGGNTPEQAIADVLIEFVLIGGGHDYRK